MARPKKKPFFDPDKEMEVLIDRVATEYGVYNDLVYDGPPGFYGKPSHTPSLNEVSRKFGLNVLKVRKLLITAGAFSTKISRLVQSLYADGVPTGEIMEKTGLSKASVNSYLPYEKTAYRMDVASPNADRIRLYRERKRAVEELSKELWGRRGLIRRIQDMAAKGQAAREQGRAADAPESKASPKESGLLLELDIFKEAKSLLWDAVRLFEGYWFGDRKGIECRYTICDDGLYFSGRGTVAKEAVDAAFAAALVSLGCGDKPGAAHFLEHLKCRDVCGIGTAVGSKPAAEYLGCQGCLGCQDCLYQMFERFGILGGEVKSSL